MGITFLPHISSRKEMLDYLKQDYCNDGEFELLDSSARGNTLYTLNLHPDGFRFIGVFLLYSPGRNSNDGWGYKAMGEESEPYYFDCPERILSKSECKTPGAVRWREECRRRRREKAIRKEWVKTLRRGDRVHLLRGHRFNPETRDSEPVYREVRFLGSFSATFFLGCFADDVTGQRYRMRLDELKLPDELKEAA